MNILNLLIKEKKVVGVEISDLVIRVAYFRVNKKLAKKVEEDATLEEKELVLIEEPIPANVILNGEVLDKQLLSKIIKNIWRKEKLGKKCAIISIPEDKIYSNIFPFPKTVNDDHLKQAVELAIDFQLPFKKEDVYVGWENSVNSPVNTNEVIISTIPKGIADNYIGALNSANIDVLALESHIASIARAIKTNDGEITLITKENKNSVTVFGLKDESLKFSRTLPAFFLNEKERLNDEVNKIKNSLENEYKEKVAILPLIEASIKDSYAKCIGLSNQLDTSYKWLISIGGAIRGEINNGEDHQISLLPIGTVEAYKYQKIKTFITLIRNMIIGVSVFFLLAFVASYLFIFSLSQTIKNTVANTPVSQTGSDIAGKEALLKRVNSLTLISSSVLSHTPNWSILIDEINSRVIDGITISNFAVPSISEKLSLSGIAINRNTLNTFKKSLQESTYLTEVELPITNLEQKGDIPFFITFKIKDPNMIYYK